MHMCMSVCACARACVPRVVAAVVRLHALWPWAFDVHAARCRGDGAGRGACATGRAHLRVRSTAREQLRMRAVLDDPSVRQDKDAIGGARLAHLVRREDHLPGCEARRCEARSSPARRAGWERLGFDPMAPRRAVPRRAGDRTLDEPLGLGVEGGGCLVQQQEARVADQRAREGDALLLPAAERRPRGADTRLEARGHRADELVPAPTREIGARWACGDRRAGTGARACGRKGVRAQGRAGTGTGTGKGARARARARAYALASLAAASIAPAGQSSRPYAMFSRMDILGKSGGSCCTQAILRRRLASSIARTSTPSSSTWPARARVSNGRSRARSRATCVHAACAPTRTRGCTPRRGV